ncbi:class II aldolase/adducin N-terminal [Aspergillus cavernicola]|uniref:glucose-6-phosphate 1-epimerase n=1 Tax=Aspergillus cavernicola TaxID=176166 RepID=A0ABR4II29_9EURO
MAPTTLSDIQPSVATPTSNTLSRLEKAPQVQVLGKTKSGKTLKIRSYPCFDNLEDERLYRKQHLAAAFRVFADRGFDEGVAGHISVRDPILTDHFWINPLSAHFSLIKVSDLILVDESGTVIEGNEPINLPAFAIHSEIHKARSDVNAACHAHSVHGKAFACFGRELEMITQDSLRFYKSHSVYREFRGVILDGEEGRRIATALGNGKAAILQNHGLLTVGQSVDEAAFWFLSLDKTCHAQLLADAAAAGGYKKILIDEEEAAYTAPQYLRQISKMDRSKKPSALNVTAIPPQPTISLNNNILQATLPTGESVTVHRYGATVISWKLANGEEQLWLSDAAALDGSKPIRGGIPVVFPVFGPPPQNHKTTPLPQHGFARNTVWEFLGKSSSESSTTSTSSDEAVKLDFGLSSSMLSPEFQEKWPYDFGLVYSVTLSREGLGTSLQVQNNGTENFEFQVLLHTYFAIDDISSISVSGLQGKSYIDKTQNASEHTESSSSISITAETDRIYKSLDPSVPLTISSSSGDLFSITRDGLTDAVVWNPWISKAQSMGDFSPDDGYKKMICVEAGAVNGWQVLEAGENWEGGQAIRPRLS